MNQARINKDYILLLAKIWILPGMILSLNLINQSDLDSISFGAMIGWINFIAATYIVFKYTGIYNVIIGVGVAVVGRLQSNSTGAFDLGDIFSIVGQSYIYFIAAYLIQRYDEKIVYRQLSFIMISSLFFMILQVLGVESSQIWSTHGGNDLASSGTFLIKFEDLNVGLQYLRPSGLFYTTVVMNIIIPYWIILHYMQKKNRLSFAFYSIFSIVMILSGGKYLIIMYMFLTLYSIYLIFPQKKIKELIKFIFIFISLFILYMNIFPGLYETNYSMITILTSFSLRLSEIFYYMSIGDLFDTITLFENINQFDTLDIDDGQTLSTYSLLAKNYQIFILLTCCFLPLIMMCFKIFLRLDKNRRHLVILGVVINSTVLFFTTLYMFQLYWFFLGLALAPLYLTPKKRSIGNNADI